MRRSAGRCLESTPVPTSNAPTSILLLGSALTHLIGEPKRGTGRASPAVALELGGGPFIRPWQPELHVTSWRHAHWRQLGVHAKKQQ
eukprot:673532-Amphidinium_carterae.1